MLVGSLLTIGLVLIYYKASFCMFDQYEKKDRHQTLRTKTAGNTLPAVADFFSRFPVSYKAVAQALLPSFKSVTLYSLLLSLLRSQKHFNTMYDMTKPQHIITVASELKKAV